MGHTLQNIRLRCTSALLNVNGVPNRGLLAFKGDLAVVFTVRRRFHVGQPRHLLLDCLFVLGVIVNGACIERHVHVSLVDD